MSNTTPSPLLTKSEAATFLGIRPRTLDDWREANAIACIERPGYVRFLRSDLEDFIRRHRREPKKVIAYKPRAGRKSTNP